MQSELTNKEQKAKQNVLIGYVLMLLGFATGILWIGGVIWAYINRSDAKGTRFYDHYDNIIRVFWISLLGVIVSVILMVILIGYLTIIAVTIWSAIKLIKGLIRLSENQPYLDPYTT